jgi:hypothetical protein
MVSRAYRQSLLLGSQDDLGVEVAHCYDLLRSYPPPQGTAHRLGDCSEIRGLLYRSSCRSHVSNGGWDHPFPFLILVVARPLRAASVSPTKDSSETKAIGKLGRGAERLSCARTSLGSVSRARHPTLGESTYPWSAFACSAYPSWWSRWHSGYGGRRDHTRFLENGQQTETQEVGSGDLCSLGTTPVQPLHLGN